MTDEELTKALHAAAADHYANMTLCGLLNAAADRIRETAELEKVPTAIKDRIATYRAALANNFKQPSSEVAVCDVISALVDTEMDNRPIEEVEAEPIVYPRLLQEYSRDGEIIQLIQETEYTHVVTKHTATNSNCFGTTGPLPLDAAQGKFAELVTQLDEEAEDG